MAAILKWPKDLPCPASQYSYIPINSFKRTQMDSGYARHRAVSRLQRFKVSVAWRIPHKNMYLFFRFIDLLNISGWGHFEVPLMFTSRIEYVSARFSNADQPYSVSNESNVNWLVHADLEVMRRTQFTPGWEQMYEFALHPDIFDLTMNEEWPEN